MPVSCFLRRLLTHASSRVRPAALFLAMAGLAATGQLALATPAHAGPAPLEKVTPYAGWQTQLGKNLSPIGEKYSTPAVGDVLGGGGTEVVAGFPDGTVRVFGADGRQLLTFNTGAGAVQASPVLVDVNHDGILDVVAANLAGDVVAFDGRGRTLFHQRVMGGVFGTPAVADLQGNGRLDVVATSWDQHVYAWHLDDASALPGWPVAVGDTIWSSPSIAHLDGDPLPEVVFGFDCDGAPGQRCAPNWGGYVGVLRHDGSWRPGFPVFVAHQVVWSTPAVADLEGTGHLDIVVGTGNMTTSMCCGKPMRGTQVFAFRADGSNVPGWPAYIGANATSSPAIGDLEGNGTLDVAIAAEDGRVHIFRRNGQQVWAACIADDFTGPCGQHLHASASIADVFGDGHQELIIGGEQWIYIFDGHGTRLAAGESAPYTDPLTATPTVAQVGGRTWIVEASTAETSGSMTARVFVWTTNRALGKADWPSFKGGPARLGVLGDRRPVPGCPPSCAPPVSRGNGLRSPAALSPGQYLRSSRGRYVAVMQTDGNLVVYDGGRALWASRTQSAGASLAIQQDGNLVVYDIYGSPRWASRTPGAGQGFLVMQDDGNLVLYAARGAAWATGT